MTRSDAAHHAQEQTDGEWTAREIGQRTNDYVVEHPQYDGPRIVVDDERCAWHIVNALNAQAKRIEELEAEAIHRLRRSGMGPPVSPDEVGDPAHCGECAYWQHDRYFGADLCKHESRLSLYHGNAMPWGLDADDKPEWCPLGGTPNCDLE